ncbi:class I and II aminotransferase [Providencia sneebia DSM 19967]|uniref:Class I and II aminotransferase n=1 Tax=Providencia sneebia DSM 19967 TaxID=1141660 RepID=K8WHZ7_9GAMM|nr:class I and II aminotransferase [Providencia sneebia DSM 19967]
MDTEFPELHWQIPEATYLAWIDLNSLNIDDNELQYRLVHQEKVAIMPGTTYGIENKGFVRMNVGCSRQKLEDGMNRLIYALKSFKAPK